MDFDSYRVFKINYDDKYHETQEQEQDRNLAMLFIQSKLFNILFILPNLALAKNERINIFY